MFKKHGVFDPKRLFGVTTLDLVRAATFVAEHNGEPLAANDYRVPVIGGHSGVTIVPLLSQSKPAFKGDQKAIEEVTNHIQFGGDDVVKAKNNAGSATLSMAFAGARFATAVLEAAAGKPSPEPVFSYVELSADPEGAKAVQEVIGDKTPFFSVPITLGQNGIEKIHPLGQLSPFENEAIKKAVESLEGNISKGVTFKL